MGDNRKDQLQGTLDLLVLRTLATGGTMHGYQITERVQQISREVLRIEAGSLYPALHRMEGSGWVKSGWAQSDNNRRARFYTLTAAGRRRLADEEEHWSALTAAVARVLGTRDMSTWSRFANITLLVQSAAGAVVPIDAVKQAIWSVSPDQPVFDIRPMSAVVRRSTAQPRLIAQLLGGFALLALLMSIVGVYMIVSYMISGRAKEVAVRRAIGAESLDVLKLLAGQTVRWTLAGLALGVGGAIAASGALRGALTGLGHLDVPTVGAVSLLYLGIVVLAVCIPAARALRLDPAAALRAE